MKYTRQLLLLLFLSYFLFPATAQEKAQIPFIITNDSVEHQAIPSDYWQVLNDTEGHYSFEQVQNGYLARKFKTLVPGKSVDFSISTYWVRYLLKNEMPSDAHISLAGHAEQAEIFV